MLLGGENVLPLHFVSIVAAAFFLGLFKKTLLGNWLW